MINRSRILIVILKLSSSQVQRTEQKIKVLARITSNLDVPIECISCCGDNEKTSENSIREKACIQILKVFEIDENLEDGKMINGRKKLCKEG